MQMMNQFGNQQRGFGGPPQPQRQGGRRGMGMGMGNRGGSGGVGFRNNSRFEPNNQNQRPQGVQGGQRPNIDYKKENVQQQKPAQAEQQQKPQQQQQQQQQPPKPPQQQAQAQKQEAPAQQTPPQPVKTPQPTPTKMESQDKVDKPVEQKPQNQSHGLQNQSFGNKNQGGHGNQNQGQGNQNQGFGNKNQSQGNQNQGQGNQNQGQGNQNQGQGNQNQGFGNKNQGHGNQNQGFGNQNQSFNNQNQGQGNQNQGPGNQNQGPGNQNQGPGNQNQGHQKNLNGNFGPGNKQGGWSQGGPGGPGNKQGGPGNRNFGPFGQGPPRNQQQQQQRGPNRGQQQDGGKPIQREEQMLANKLKDLVGPLVDLAPIDQTEVKFNGRSRLYIGNLTNDVTEDEIMTMFGAFGEAAELFLNKEKNFGFIKMDCRVNAERARAELDGKVRNGRTLRVRFAPHNSAVRVKNLPPFVSNELLYRAFEIFGKIERAYVKVDERGKTLGEGVVEYVRKPSALAAIRNCTEKCFFLTSSLRPVIVENFEEPDEVDGYPEKNLPKKHPEFIRAREVGPRFSEQNSFEHEYGTRWKQLHELHRQKEDALKKELAAEEEKLEAQMEYAKYEHETELLREQLRQREQDRDRQKRSWEMAERAAEERRDAERAQLLRQEEELSQRMRQQDDELRRRQQENTLFVQAQRLNSMLDRQEQGMFDQQQPMDGGFRDQYDMPRGGYDDMQQGRGWDGPRQMDDFPNKRRRF